ncbi:hypothetical protein WA158_003670 [Blastocystis sp. Blastoise]
MQHSKAPGFFPSLLNVINTDEMDIRVKKAALIFMKNVLEIDYSHVNEIKSILSDEDKNYLKQNLIQILCNQTNLTFVTLISPLLQSMIMTDFPNDWSYLIPQIHEQLNKTTFHNLYSILCVIKILITCFKYDYNHENSIMAAIKNEFFPQLLSIANGLIDSPQEEESYHLLNLIIKCYYHSISKSCFLILDQQQLKEWVQLFITLNNRDYPSIPADKMGSKDDYILSKCKKNSLKCLYQLQLYLFREETSDNTSVYEFWQTGVIPAVMKSISIEMEGFIRCSYWYSKTLVMSLRLITCFPPSALYEYISIFLQFLSVILSLTEEDLLLYAVNPHDYMVKQASDFDYYSIVPTVEEFIRYFCNEVQEFPRELWSMIEKKLINYSQLPESDQSMGEKESYLHVICILNDIISIQETLHIDTESFLYTYVLKELNSKEPLMKARAIATYRSFLLDIKNEEHKNILINCVSNEINQNSGNDNCPNLCIYIECANCIDAMIMNDEWTDIFLPHISSILSRYVYIISISCLSSPLTSLNHLLTTYSAHIGPYVPRLTEEIINILEDTKEYFDFIKEGENIERCNECINILYNIYSIEIENKEEEICNYLEDILLKLISTFLVDENIDYFTNSCLLLSLLLYHTKNYNQNYRYIFAGLCRYFYDFDLYYYKYLYYPIIYYLYKDTEYVLSYNYVVDGNSIPSTQLFHKMYTSAIKEGDYTYINITVGIFVAVALNGLSISSSLMDPLLSLSLETLSKYLTSDPEDDDIHGNNSETGKRQICVESLMIIEACICSDPRGTFEYLQTNAPTFDFFSVLESYIDLHVSKMSRQLLCFCVNRMITVAVTCSDQEYLQLKQKLRYMYNLYTEYIYQLYIGEQEEKNNDNDDEFVDTDTESLSREYLSPLTTMNHLNIYKQLNHNLDTDYSLIYSNLLQNTPAHVQEAVTVLMNME